MSGLQRKSSWPISRYNSRILLEGLRNTMTQLKQCRWTISEAIKANWNPFYTSCSKIFAYKRISATRHSNKFTFSKLLLAPKETRDLQTIWGHHPAENVFSYTCCTHIKFAETGMSSTPGEVEKFQPVSDGRCYEEGSVDAFERSDCDRAL
jgi:hypothetical protein